jgi:hypothetical protein
MSKFESYPEATFTLEQYRAMSSRMQDVILRSYRHIPEVEARVVTADVWEGAESDAA